MRFAGSANVAPGFARLVGLPRVPCGEGPAPTPPRAGRGSAGEGIDDGGEEDDHSRKIITDHKNKGAVYDHLEGRRGRRWVQGGATHQHRHGSGFGALFIDFDKISLHDAHQVERLAVADAF